jgi:ATP-dependent Clp protease ATP-binding subunit ClpC
MFERYTESARRALFFARYETTELGGVGIETEHLLLGLLRQARGLTGNLFARAHLSYGDARTTIQARIVVREKIPTSVEIPFSLETKRALTYAAEEADRLGHSYIGTEHLLLGLLREEGSVAASILTSHGMSLESARNEIVELMSAAPLPSTDASDVVARLDHITHIKALVDQLGRAPANSESARHLIELIHNELESLKPPNG